MAYMLSAWNPTAATMEMDISAGNETERRLVIIDWLVMTPSALRG